MSDKPAACSTPKLCTVSGRKPIHESISIQSPIEKELSRSSSNEEFHSYTAEGSNQHKEYIEEHLVQSEKECEGSSSGEEESNKYRESLKYRVKLRSTPKRLQSANAFKYQEQLLQRSKSEETKSSSKSHNLILNRKEQVQFNPITVALLSLVCMFALYAYFQSKATEEDHWENLKKLSKKYNSQSKDFWRNIQVMIEEVKNLEQPKSLVFVYSEGNYRTVKEIILAISQLATCIISRCNSSVVRLVPEDFSTTEVMQEYGKIITRTKTPLEESGVMIVENIERISGGSAQAFHSLCDEENPVVSKALFLFTMKMNKLPSNEAVGTHFPAVRDRLQVAWRDLSNDKFHPLVTRVANVILPVMPVH
nr:unnamed protein product [Callosobruchus chinensis]